MGRVCAWPGRNGGCPPPLRLLVVAAAAAGSWFAAGTSPFTDGADAACAAAFAAVGIGFLARRAPLVTLPEDRAERRVTRGALWPWGASLLLLAAWELVTYLAGLDGRRQDYPTISSLYDEFANWRAAKALAFLLWVGLGWRVFRRR